MPFFSPTFECLWQEITCQSLQLKYGKRFQVKIYLPSPTSLFAFLLCIKLIRPSAGCSLGKYPYIFHSPPALAWVWARKHHLTFQRIASGCLLCKLWGWTQVLKMNLRIGKRLCWPMEHEKWRSWLRFFFTILQSHNLQHTLWFVLEL